MALARAFAPKPKLLLADEPTGNLDGATGRVVLDLLVSLRAEEGATLVLVTHDPAVAAVADRRIHLSDGRIDREESAWKTSLWLALAAREFKGSVGRLLFFAACLSVGVAAVVAVAGLSEALDKGIQAQARQLLAADLAISSGRPIPDVVAAAAAAIPGARRVEVGRCRVWSRYRT